MVKLHLGCGKKKFRGYINIDNVGTPDVWADITALPYGLETAEEILAIHVFEHIFPHLAEATLKHWYGILKPGGKLIMEMPDLKKVIAFFGMKDAPASHTMFALYGGEQTGRIEDVHKWCWTYSVLEPALTAIGFKCEEKPALFHIPERDFRIEATK